MTRRMIRIKMYICNNLNEFKRATKIMIDKEDENKKKYHNLQNQNTVCICHCQGLFLQHVVCECGPYQRQT